MKGSSGHYIVNTVFRRVPSFEILGGMFKTNKQNQASGLQGALSWGYHISVPRGAMSAGVGTL